MSGGAKTTSQSMPLQLQDDFSESDCTAADWVCKECYRSDSKNRKRCYDWAVSEATDVCGSKDSIVWSLRLVATYDP